MKYPDPYPVIPEDAEVFRASGLYQCEICGKLYYDHPRYRNVWGDGYEIKGCDGVFYHL